MKKLANEFSSTVNDASRCLYCGPYLEEGVCKHCGENHEEMMVSLNRYLDALCALSEQAVRDGSGEAKRIVRDAKGLRLAEKAILPEAIKLVARLGASENYETAQDLLMGEFGSQMKNIFADFFLRYDGQRSKADRTIWHMAGSWTATHYSAENAEECIESIIQESKDATE